jgi:hypothetical protein
MAILDRFLAAIILNHGREAGDTKVIKSCRRAQHVSAACFVLATKFVGSSSPRIEDILRVLQLECSFAEIALCEEEVLKSIDWALHLTTGNLTL